ncbi:hypothetical protein SAMN05421678_107237 [Actinopolymorpha cephalotaxi]|uniref:Uncharacterized protein n=1 Tax=Actinopolymorpha cephalotaxi TaxID=504797 RepID=A0A1I2TKQ8_9ACTN|nr:hypothetical protein SAMN05421678_107237 [Actinopolymorpha cephalotaxi]
MAATQVRACSGCAKASLMWYTGAPRRYRSASRSEDVPVRGRPAPISCRTTSEVYGRLGTRRARPVDLGQRPNAARIDGASAAQPSLDTPRISSVVRNSAQCESGRSLDTL